MSLSPESSTDYDVRLFDVGDTSAYLSLYETGLGTATEEWFAWKYEDNPYIDHVPIVVVVDEGRLVGAKSMLGMKLRRGGETLTALQPCDTVVHPDYRRQGLFSRMTEFAADIYADRDVDLFFNFPNPATLSGGLKHGWERVGHLPIYYRVQNPASYADIDEGPFGSLIDSLSVCGLEAYYRFLSPSVDRSSSFSIERRSAVPVAELVRLYERNVPDRIHTVRDARYYDWRFDTPEWTYETYLAKRNGETVAAIVVGTDPDGTDSTVHLTEALPLGSDSRPPEPFEAILHQLLDRYRDAEVIAAAGDSLPTGVYRNFGFRPDTEPPITYVTTTDTMIANPFGRRPDDTSADPTVRSNWLLTFADMDTR